MISPGARRPLKRRIAPILFDRLSGNFSTLRIVIEIEARIGSRLGFWMVIDRRVFRKVH